MSSFFIRRATAADLPEVQHILRETQLGEEGLSEHFPNFFVAEVDGAIVGVIGIEVYGEQGLVRSAAVLQPFQRRGIGDALVDAVERFGLDCGVKEFALLTTSAAEYFERRGFVRVARDTIRGTILSSEQFRGTCPSTAAVMRKTLRG